jgi:D-sedoheptulose 7-phosphate isomerase
MHTMSGSLREYLTESGRVLQAAGESITQESVDEAVTAIVTALAAGKPLLVCGNGGSAADAGHITAELVGRFLEERRALNAICLTGEAAVLTSCGNDHGFESVFARQVEAYGGRGAVLLGLSTSGNSANVVAAFEKARAMGMITIALTGEGGGRLGPLSNYLLAVPSRETPLIQQVHLCLYHYLCGEIERRILSQPGQAQSEST